MNASPHAIVPTIIVLIPALICLLGIGIGIVIAFRKGDARLPLGIGGVAFVLLYFLSRIRSAPAPASGPVNLSVAPAVTHLKTFPTWGVLLLILVVLAGTTAVIAAIRYQRIGTLAVVSALILAAFFVVGFSATSVQVQQTTVVSDSRSPQLIESSIAPETSLTESDRPAAVASGPTPTKIEHIVGNGLPEIVTEFPEWRIDTSLQDARSAAASRYVIPSQQFASPSEAEAHLLQITQSAVRDRMAGHWPETQDWIPTPEEILASGLISEKVIETIPLKVGEFEQPVYRVSWLVDFRPEVRDALHALWAPREAERRSRWLLTGLAGITGLLGATSIVLRRQRQQTADSPA